MALDEGKAIVFRRLARRMVHIVVTMVALSAGLFALMTALPGDPVELLITSDPSVRAEDVARLKRLRGLDQPWHIQYWRWLYGYRRVDAPAQPFVRGAMFALAGDTDALGYSSSYRRPVWEVLFGAEAVCGDGAVQPGELCDDGNLVAGDGCSSKCISDGATLGQRYDAWVAGGLLNAGRVFNTLWLMVPALLLSILLGVLLGVFTAVRAGEPIDRFINGAAFVGISVPAFWLGIMVLFVFAEHLRLLPAGGAQTPGIEGGAGAIIWDRVVHAIGPVVVLSVIYAGRWLRYTRSAMLEALPSDYVRTARANGLSPRAVIWRHAFRNALLPLVTVLSMSIPVLFSGALLTEQVFSWPGLGRLQFEAVINNDSYLAIVVFLVTALLVMLSNLLADVLYAILDPRIRRP